MSLTPALIIYRLSPEVTNPQLNELFFAAWPDAVWCDFAPLLNHSLAYVCAYDHERLIGFVNLAWDGGIHAFLLDTTVHPAYQRQGIGTELVRMATEAARAAAIEWIHVDFESHLTHFYRGCGFVYTAAGLLHLG